VAPDFRRQPVASPDELIAAQLAGSGRGPIDEIGDAACACQQRALFRWVQNARRESGAVQSGPETVARTGEVKAGRGRIEPGIDADEKDLEPGSDDVAQPPPGGLTQLASARPA